MIEGIFLYFQFICFTTKCANEFRILSETLHISAFHDTNSYCNRKYVDIFTWNKRKFCTSPPPHSSPPGTQNQLTYPEFWQPHYLHTNTLKYFYSVTSKYIFDYSQQKHTENIFPYTNGFRVTAGSNRLGTLFKKAGNHIHYIHETAFMFLPVWLTLKEHPFDQ